MKGLDKISLKRKLGKIVPVQNEICTQEPDYAGADYSIS